MKSSRLLGDQVAGDDVRYLQSLSTELEQICLGDKLVSDNEWHSDYVKFVDHKRLISTIEFFNGN